MVKYFFGFKRSAVVWTTLLCTIVLLWVLKLEYAHIRQSQPSFQQYQEKIARPKTTKIPKIIHQIWNEELIPDQFVENIRSLIKYNPHPEWQYRFYTLQQGREFVKQKFPKLLQIYDGSNKYTKPDILRFLAIYYYGGVYFDLDIFGVRPLDRFVEQHECALNGPSPEHFVAYGYKFDPLRVNNAIFLCRQNHPFFKLLITRSETQSSKCQNLTCPMPEFPFPLLTYLNEQNLKHLMPEITSSDFFEPFYDLTVTHLLEKKCSGMEYEKLEQTKRIICDNWKQRGKDNKSIPEIAYTVHTWFHTGANKVTTLLNLTISDIVPHVQFYT